MSDLQGLIQAVADADEAYVRAAGVAYEAEVAAQQALTARQDAKDKLDDAVRGAIAQAKEESK